MQTNNNNSIYQTTDDNSGNYYTPVKLFHRGLSPLAKLFLAILCSLLLIFLDANGDQKNNSRFQLLFWIRGVVITSIYPLQETIIWWQHHAKKLITTFVTLHKLQNDNTQFSKQIIQLEQKILRNAFLEQENVYLQKLLEFRNEKYKEQSEQPSKLFQLFAAQILYETSDFYKQRIIINKGSTNGFNISMPIINNKGVLGQITRIFPLQAEVTLLSDKELFISAQLLRTGLRALVSGSAKFGYLEMHYIPNGTDIKPGDVLVTSGLDGVYPPGLPLANIVYTGQNKNKPEFALVLAKPIANLRNYRHVLALNYDAQMLPPPPNKSIPSLRDKKGRLLKN